MTDPQLRVLASRESLPGITRRAFLAGMTVTAVAGGGVVLTACGDGGAEEAQAATTGVATPTDLGDRVNLYSWAAYTAPALLKRFAQETGVTTAVDVFDSSEQAIAKLNIAQGTSAYDVVVSNGIYIPAMVQQELLQPLDKSALTNLANLDPQYLDQAWDPGNTYSVPKDWGTTGYMYDTRVVTRPMSTWQDFVDAMQAEAAGKTSILGTPANVGSLYFWTQDPPGDWTTTDPAELDRCETYTVQEVAPYVRAYDSYPGISMTQGKYALSMVWNGDARAGLVRGGDTDSYRWVLPGPVTEIWTDNWTVVADAPHVAAAHAWIDFMLVPANSFVDLQYHGYNTGIAGMEEKAKAADLPFLDIIFPTPEQLATMVPGAANEGVDRLTEIYQKAKAVSAGG